jgi:hypothetical protein
MDALGFLQDRPLKWIRRHGPVLPFVAGIGALLASGGVLAMLLYGVCNGRPDTPDPFICWIGLSIAGLLIVAFQWSRWTFIGFAAIVLVLLFILVAEFGEITNRHIQLSDAVSDERVLVLQLGRSEHLAAANQLKSLAASSTGATPPPTNVAPGSSSDVAPSISALRWDLQRVLDHQLAAPKLITAINFDQVVLSSSLIAGRSTGPASGVSVVGPALSLRWSSYFSTATESLQALCRTVGLAPSGAPSWLCPRVSPRSLTNLSPAQLAQALTPAVSAVSSAAEEVQPSTANAQRLAANDNALITAFAEPLRSSVDIAGDLSNGAGALVAFIERASPAGSWWYASFDTGAWIVLAVLLLIGLRSLLLINNKNGWGPIEVVMGSANGEGKPPTADAERLATIRSYIVENVPEPAAALGSSAMTQITTLVSSAKSVAPPWLSALANFLGWALLPPSGYRVVIDFRTPEKTPRQQEPDAAPVTAANSGTPGAPAGREIEMVEEIKRTSVRIVGGTEGATAGPHPTDLSVVVRIATRGRSKVLDVTTIDPLPTDQETEEDVLRAAGYWAAGWILSQCKLVPAWTAWPPSAGRYLGRYIQHKKGTDIEVRAGTLEENDDELIDGPINDLEDARARGPMSGLILTRLAEEYEFRDEFANALEINLQVARLYPRYYVARYRVAVGLSLLVRKEEGRMEQSEAQRQQERRILRLIRQIDAGGHQSRTVSTTDHLDVPLVPSPAKEPADKAPTTGPPAADPPTVREVNLSLLCAGQLKSAMKLANFGVMCTMALRRDERRFWLARMRHPFLIRHNLGSAMPSISSAAGYRRDHMAISGLDKRTVKRFFARPSLKSVVRWTTSRNESAQVFYNLACFFARDRRGPDVRRAMRLLEATQAQPYADQIEASWMERDPDLSPLHDDNAPNDVAVRFDRLVNVLRGGSKATTAREVTNSR